jgi:hypothetical protein
MNVSIMNISTMADARIDAIELALDNEIEDRQADLNRQITNLTASLTDYADDVRRDSSAYTKELDLEPKEYIDNKIYDLRTEKNNDIANLSDTMRAYTDGSINRMKNIIDGEIAQAVTGVNARMDSSLAALKTYTDQKNEELRGELEDAYEAADNVLYNRLNNKIDQNADEFDASLATLGTALRSEITNGDASVLVAARAMSNDTSAKAKSDNDELEAELYTIIPNKPLKLIAQEKPVTLQTLKEIEGMGPKRVKAYGAEILDIVLRFMGEEPENANFGDIPKEPEKKEKKPKGETYRITKEMFDNGMSVEAIAKERGYAVGTIYGHLTRFVEQGVLEASQFVDKEKYNEILEYFESTFDPQINIAREVLGDTYNYGEIRAVLAELEREHFFENQPNEED